ncbi:MAG: hypothetical protein LBI95_03905 [Holosporales bacterium]|jgi:4-diphosphocytidyl-2-C-methyl-D-erythritol kinase|nr:hypothetical protein [Holosporales bacterium]
MSGIVSRSVAKVNLALNITKKNDDGYHSMESVFAFLNEIYDTLTLYPNIEFNENSGTINGVLDEENSIKKAFKILKDNFNLKIPHVTIKKKLPISGGVGGGSSNSACFVNAVFDIWKFSQHEKMKYMNVFRELGADARVFLYKYFTNAKFVYLDGTGIDGTLLPINLETGGQCILLINNATKLSTKSVFKGFCEKFRNKLGVAKMKRKILKTFHNSLQKSAIELEPSIQNILANMKSTFPIFWGVSGSGPTCFALYKDVKKARLARRALSEYEFTEIGYI